MTARERALHQTDGSLPPREKLAAYGPAYLADRELLAVLLGTGTRGKPVHRLAEEVLAILDEASGRPDLQDLRLVSGLGTAKSSLITAAFELARRVLCPGTHRIRFPADVIPLVRHYADRKQEHFLSLSLNGAHEVSAIRVVSVGLVNRALVSSCGSRAFSYLPLTFFGILDTATTNVPVQQAGTWSVYSGKFRRTQACSHLRYHSSGFSTVIGFQ